MFSLHPLNDHCGLPIMPYYEILDLFVIRVSKNHSVLFDSVKLLGLSQSFPKYLPVFYVNYIAANSWIKDIGEGVFPKKYVADHPHAVADFGICPEPS